MRSWDVVGWDSLAVLRSPYRLLGWAGSNLNSNLNSNKTNSPGKPNTCPKSDSKVTPRFPKWSQYDPKMIPIWPQNNPKSTPTRRQDDPKTTPRWFRNRDFLTQDDPKWWLLHMNYHDLCLWFFIISVREFLWFLLMNYHDFCSWITMVSAHELWSCRFRNYYDSSYE